MMSILIDIDAPRERVEPSDADREYVRRMLAQGARLRRMVQQEQQQRQGDVVVNANNQLNGFNVETPALTGNQLLLN